MKNSVVEKAFKKIKYGNMIESAKSWYIKNGFQGWFLKGIAFKLRKGKKSLKTKKPLINKMEKKCSKQKKQKIQSPGIELRLGKS